ncbi:MAG: NAD(P)H-dependent oxidoreductase subunit E [Ignavibacteriales bacterium]|nr:NAD(P)H-dependent oxidoreductase subunit E [Ignavibacteriales bacterium]
MEFTFTQQNLEKIDQILKKYPTKKAALMPLLWLAQEQNGFISGEVMKSVASILEVSLEEVLGVVTFYTMYHQHEMGKYHFQVCTNVSCLLRGGYDIWNHVRSKLKIENGQVTSDKKFSLEEVECMGSCGSAPMMAVNEDYYENLSLDQVDQIIESFK